MKNLALLLLILSALTACNRDLNHDQNKNENTISVNDSNRFADLRILTYDASGINDLSVKQKELVYYLSQAALSGREITYAQNYKHNIQIKRVLETIYTGLPRRAITISCGFRVQKVMGMKLNSTAPRTWQ